MIDLFAAAGRDKAYEEHIDVSWWFKELMVCYKYGEKFRYEKALKVLSPFLDDKLIQFFEDILHESTWTNPITGKKGF